MKVVLNTVEPDQIKSVDAKTIEDTPMHTRRDATRDSALSAFSLDVSRDLLRAVTGRPSDTSLGSRITGSDSLGIYTQLPLPELASLLSLLLDAYASTAYKEHFEFIDYLRAEKSQEKIEGLNARLLEDLRSRSITDAHLAAPETLDWIDVAGFRFSYDSEEPLRNDPSIGQYLGRTTAEDLTIDRLKRDRVVAVHDTHKKSWSIFESLVYEAKIDGTLYVLTGGDWFRVHLEFAERVEADLARLGHLEGLPTADLGSDEDAYNRKAADALGAVLLDKRFVYDGGPDKMEVCDLLLADKTLVHVKLRGKSSTLSHLFAQGVASGERVLSDPEFRRQARGLVMGTGQEFSDAFPHGRPEVGKYTVAFVVITRSVRQEFLTLPFFSRVSLRAAARRLELLGFNVKVAAVREVSADP